MLAASANAVRFGAMLIAFAACAADARAQAPGSYSDYYGKQLTSFRGTVGAPTPNRYLYDKYFYHRPSVSPYLNVGRLDTMSGTSYQAYIRPELQRREATAAANRAYVQQRKLEGRVGETRYPGAGFVGGTINDAILKPVQPVRTTPSSYYNHWYGGWANR
jgi:hypothetical protein